ncbi:uncharacterized protein LOC133843408 [Drosophila sulfurigaster albostrigata]|uniref:uncharacterized protein LOC133843408 n=1 Tax=Drosophila sulfurigaster albostrigata TaxID=89887 RepID=UPI002D21DFEB|nr:uncharacterized protein LOC133843408 [Drosophila sulfurigaster albostrigata]XP_062132917.1 uncharacterized protein LOC133843408 [Drosophila sulfurigaster albostrigata]XP_062132918.1 uncharacterized protein LOC133843408 [Drosophila sulfurigaster albostrigata]
MQDLTREEAIAFNACEPQHNNNNHNHNNISNRHTTTAVNNNKAQMCTSMVVPKFQKLSHDLLTNIKLEVDSGSNLESELWQQTTVNERLRLELNSTKLLLQGSDDPLISHGASNDPHDEDQDYPFKTLLARKTEEQQAVPVAVHNGAQCSTLTKQQLKANLMNGRKVQQQRSQPLDELASSPSAAAVSVAAATQRATRQSKSKKRSNANGAMKLRFHHQALPAEYAAHYEATQGRQVSAARTMPVEAPVVKAAPPTTNHSHENVRSWLRKIAEIQRNAERQQQAQANCKEAKKSTVVAAVATAVAPPPPPAVTLLEPLREVPLPNPKRSAMKYADLPYMGEITLDNYKPRRGRKPKKADICHLIYKNYGTIIPSTPATATTATTSAQHFPAVADLKSTPALLSQRSGPLTLPAAGFVNLVDEPLNLCMRDQSSDRYSISSGDSERPSTDLNATANFYRPEDNKPFSLEFTEDKKSRISAKLLLKPMGLYYQQIMETCRLGLPVETIEKDNQLALKIPIPNGFFANMNPTAPTAASSPAAKREPLEQQQQQQSPEAVTPPAMRKRKRSAIFIPPMPAEHSSSPSTEVSICKFKFTGGAKPTLQEKKMLSVDAEGNYRYYNGTGDRNMRGYEFISRDQQQQQQQQQMQSHSISSNGSSDNKLYIDIPPPSTDLSLELLHIPPESPTSSLLMSSSLVPVEPQSPSCYSSSHSPMRLSTPHPEDYHKRTEELPQRTFSSPTPTAVVAATKRRSSRRSKQREKLEKTFKEKGFLIQTQQLQSAEGATYCKFRQLKKFTRYLFRNWKDHIPESDLDKHAGKDSDTRVIENMLAGQIGLGLQGLGATQTAANQAT